jgi:uncharacterized membrane protein
MDLDEGKPIDVKVKITINQKVLLTSLFAITGSILLTGLLLYLFASAFIPTLASIIIGLVLLFFSVYFPVQSPHLFCIKSEVVDIEEEELEELQSVMKPW